MDFTLYRERDEVGSGDGKEEMNITDFEKEESLKTFP